MSPRTILVTGTDTEVGKTVVSCALARALVRKGLRVLAIKPVESGTGEDPAPDEDGVRLARATGQENPAAALVRLRTPVAPPVAADLDGVRLDHVAWCEAIRDLGGSNDIVLVEGAGGLLSPLTWESTARDLAVDLGAEALVVAPDALGCLNHVLMTLEILEAAGVPLLGVVFSALTAPDDSTGKNAEALRRFSGLSRIASLPRLDDPDAAADHLADVANWLDDR
jgi:dethiobiotin synthetase